jgi:hypothetical protein
MEEKIYNLRFILSKSFPFVKIKGCWGDIDLKEAVENGEDSPFIIKVFNQKYNLLFSSTITISSDLYTRLRAHGRITVPNSFNEESDLVVTDWSDWKSENGLLVLNVTVYDPSADKRPLKKTGRFFNSWEHLYGNTHTSKISHDTAYRSIKN